MKKLESKVDWPMHFSLHRNKKLWYAIKGRGTINNNMFQTARSILNVFIIKNNRCLERYIYSDLNTSMYTCTKTPHWYPVNI